MTATVERGAAAAAAPSGGKGKLIVLALGGLVLTELPGRGLYALYAGDSPIMAVRATLAPGAPPPGDAGQDEDED